MHIQSINFWQRCQGKEKGFPTNDAGKFGHPYTCKKWISTHNSCQIQKLTLKQIIDLNIKPQTCKIHRRKQWRKSWRHWVRQRFFWLNTKKHEKKIIKTGLNQNGKFRLHKRQFWKWKKKLHIVRKYAHSAYLIMDYIKTLVI